MSKIAVNVHLKPEILDPQGRAIFGALSRFELKQAVEVRQGKQFILTLDGDISDPVLIEIHNLASSLLSNPIIETYSIEVLDDI